MARLGSIVGAVLAELGRSRLAADQLSRTLVDEYRNDPVLASMSVPRVLIEEAELTLRFVVSDVEESEAASPAAAEVAEGWARHATAILPDVLRRHGLVEEEHRTAMDRLVVSRAGTPGRPTATLMAAALTGDSSGAAAASVESLLGGWSRLPRDVRAKLGTKAEFRRELQARLGQELRTFVDRAQEFQLVRAALASKIDIAIRSNELPTQTDQIHELRLKVREEDISLILEQGTEGQ